VSQVHNITKISLQSWPYHRPPKELVAHLGGHFVTGTDGVEQKRVEGRTGEEVDGWGMRRDKE